MSILTRKQNEIISKAYKNCLVHVSTEEEKVKYENFTYALNEFLYKLKTWKSNDNLDFIIDFALSKEADIFARVGMGKIFINSFRTFMDMNVVRENFEKMINYKFNVSDNVQKYNSLLECDIRKFLDTNEFEFGKPLILTSRLLLMIFTELFTPIADEAALKDACRKLDININTDTRYLAKQRQIRCMIDTYLKENDLYDELDETGRARIAWEVAVG